MSWLRSKRSTTKEDEEDRRTSVTEDLELADSAAKKISERSQADQSGTNDGEAKAKGEKKKDGKAKGDLKKEEGKAKGDLKKKSFFGRKGDKEATAAPAMSELQMQDKDQVAESDPKDGFTTGPQQRREVSCSNVGVGVGGWGC